MKNKQVSFEHMLADILLQLRSTPHSIKGYVTSRVVFQKKDQGTPRSAAPSDNLNCGKPSDVTADQPIWAQTYREAPRGQGHIT